MEPLGHFMAAVLARKAAKEINKTFSDNSSSTMLKNSSGRNAIKQIRQRYFHEQDITGGMLEELFRLEPDLADDTFGSDYREFCPLIVEKYALNGQMCYEKAHFTLSAKDRFFIKGSVDNITQDNLRDCEYEDYSEKLFNASANPSAHTLSIAGYTLYFDAPFFYNLALILMMDSDQKFRNGFRIKERAVSYPEICVDENIVVRYNINVDEDKKTGLKLKNASYAELNDFNSEKGDDYRKKGNIELRIVDRKTNRSDSSVPFAINDMLKYRQDVLKGNKWISISPGTIMYDGTYLLNVPFLFLDSADDFFIRGDENKREIYVCRLKDGWGGIKFTTQSVGDYYALAIWLILACATYFSILWDCDRTKLIQRYWPSYEPPTTLEAESNLDINEGLSNVGGMPYNNESRRDTIKQIRQRYFCEQDVTAGMLEELFYLEPDLTDSSTGSDYSEFCPLFVDKYSFNGQIFNEKTVFTLDAKDRFFIHDRVDNYTQDNLRDCEYEDYSEKLFGASANPNEHTISVAGYTIYFDNPFFYNLSLMLMVDSDNKYRNGYRIKERSISYPKIFVDANTIAKYNINIDENKKSGLQLRNASCAILNDFNSEKSVYDKKEGNIELRIVDCKINTSDYSQPFAINDMLAYRQDVLEGRKWITISPGTIMDGGLYLLDVPFFFFYTADDLTIRGDEEKKEIYVCRLKDGWGGIKFTTQTAEEYFTLATWLVLACSTYLSVLWGRDRTSMIREYWPSYEPPASLEEGNDFNINEETFVDDIGDIGEKENFMNPVLNEDEERPIKSDLSYELPEELKGNRQICELVDDFNIIEPEIKDEWGDYENVIDNIIKPMLGLDVRVGTELWLKLLKDFYPQESNSLYHLFTNYPFKEADREDFVHALESSSELREYLFHLAPSDSTYYVADFILDLVLHKEYVLADEILSLYNDNYHGGHNPQKTLYETLSRIAGNDYSKWLIDKDGIAFVDKWMDQLTDDADKAKVRIKLRSLKQIVFEGAPKGPVPLGILNEIDPSDEKVKLIKMALEEED